MAFEFGFYNSIDGDRTYDADQFGDLFTGLITDGVYASIGDALMTTPGPGLSVLVGTGRAWFNKTWNVNRTKMQLNLDLADLLLPRIDAVVLEVNKNSFSRTNSIKIITGTPSANPTRPGYSATNNVYQYPLAYIYVKANAEAIEAKDITVVVGQAPTNFVSAMLDTVDITTMYQHWEQQFSDWFADVQSQLSDDVAGNLLHKLEVLEGSVEDINSSVSTLSSKIVTLSSIIASSNSLYVGVDINISGSWVPPSNYNPNEPCLVICVGGGGGAGGIGTRYYSAPSNRFAVYVLPGAGGSGYVVIKHIKIPVTGCTVTVGGGGAGGAGNISNGDASKNGKNGGNTIVSINGNNAIVASGGFGGSGSSNTTPGAGGAGNVGGSCGISLYPSRQAWYGGAGNGYLGPGTVIVSDASSSTPTIAASIGGPGLFAGSSYASGNVLDSDKTTAVASFIYIPGGTGARIPVGNWCSNLSGDAANLGAGGSIQVSNLPLSNPGSNATNGGAGGPGRCYILYKIKS